MAMGQIKIAITRSAYIRNIVENVAPNEGISRSGDLTVSLKIILY